MNLIPRPASVTPGAGTFGLTAAARILVDAEPNALPAAGRALAGQIRTATGHALPVLEAEAPSLPGDLVLTMAGADPALGEEGYDLVVTPDNVRILAPRPAGLFYGVQTLCQLLPAAPQPAALRPEAWLLPACTIRDTPRFRWRGMMLDVARHFFGVDDVKRLIDLLACYKLNRLHLHLTDDQGWRIEIRSWPRLVTVGASTSVGAGLGGFYTQADYAEIVAYAQERAIIVVPEIEMPGHCGAALASYAELNRDGIAPPLDTGTEVGRSTLCIDREITYRFVEDVVRELAALTPGPYLHVGGDEAWSTDPAGYRAFIERVQAIAQRYGKQMVGWEEIAQARLLPSTVVQHWLSGLASQAVSQGAKVIMSPAMRTYLDMKYAASTPLGLEWAGCVEVPDAYDWDPATQVPGVAEGDLLGVEAPLWSETLRARADLEYMAFPRLIGIAEIGWSPAVGRSWEEYRERLAAHGPRLAAMGVAYYRSPAVPWL